MDLYIHIVFNRATISYFRVCLNTRIFSGGEYRSRVDIPYLVLCARVDWSDLKQGNVERKALRKTRERRKEGKEEKKREKKGKKRRDTKERRKDIQVRRGCSLQVL